MIGIISIDKILFTSRVSHLDSAAREFDTSLLNTGALDFNSTALQQYINCFNSLSNIMSLYISLLIKDAGELKKIGEAYISADIKTARIWGGFNALIKIK